MAQPILNVTELDFDQIKANIKTYFKRQESPFQDWDFDGSGLSVLLDVLAYNTQYNAMLSHLTLNESYIDTAQLRSSVASHAKLLGYTPRSTQASKALISAVFTKNPASDAKTLLLPRGTAFTSSLNGVAYNFLTTESKTVSLSNDGTFKFSIGVIPMSNATGAVSTIILKDNTQNWTPSNLVYLLPSGLEAPSFVNGWHGFFVHIISGTGAGSIIEIDTNTGNTLTFKSAQTFAPDSTSRYTIVAPGEFDNALSIVEGSLKSVSFNVDNSIPNQKFIIEDDFVDISTLHVRVYDYSNSSRYLAFVPFTSLNETKPDSQVYFISQNTRGKYEISFGNDKFGKALNNLNIVRLEFVITSAQVANGASTFKYSGKDLFDELGGKIVKNSPIITTVSVSSSGAPEEGIEAIRFNAPNSLITQNRAVTANDYKTILLNAFPYIQSISVWGGEDEIQFDPGNAGLYAGQVYISVKQAGSDANLTLQQKNAMEEVLDTKRVMTIKTNFIDPDYTYIYMDTYFKYSSNLTTNPGSVLESNIAKVIKNYSTQNLLRFDGVFRFSNFLNQIDISDPAILNSEANVYFYKNYTITPHDMMAAGDSQPADATNLAILQSQGKLVTRFSGPLYGNLTQSESMIKSDGWLYDIPGLAGSSLYYLKDGPPFTSNSRAVYMSRTQTARATGTLSTDIRIGTLYPATGKLELAYFSVGTAIGGSLIGQTVTLNDNNALDWNIQGATVVTSSFQTSTVSDMSLALTVAPYFPAGRWIYIYSGTGRGAYGLITAATNTQIIFTVPVGLEFIPDNTTVYQIFKSGIDSNIELVTKIYSESASNDIAPRRNQILEIDMAKVTITSSVDTIAISGIAGIDTYTTFPQNLKLQ